MPAVVRPMKRQEIHLLLFTGVGHFFTHLSMLLFPSLAMSVARDLGIRYGEAIDLSFAGYLLFGLGALPVGIIGDRVRKRPLLLLNLLGMALSCLAVGALPGATGIMLGLAVLGLTASIYHPAAMSLLSQHHRRGRLLGINGVLGSLGIALAPVTAEQLSTLMNWRSTYLVVGGIGIISVLALSLLPVQEQEPTPLAAPALSQGLDRGAPFNFALLCLAMLFAGMSYRGNTLTHPRFFEESLSFIGYGTATSLLYALGMLGQLWGGYAADRSPTRAYLLSHASSLPFLLLMAFTGGAALFSCAGVYIFFAFGMQPAENSLVARYVPVRLRTTGYGIKFILGFAVSAVMTKFVKWHDSRYDLQNIYIWFSALVAAVVLISATIAFIDKPTRDGQPSDARHPWPL